MIGVRAGHVLRNRYAEHHCLAEYSHLSAPAPVMGYVAAKSEEIHIGSDITSLPTSKEHPVRLAEWAAVIHEIPRMWGQVDYQIQGNNFSKPTPHNVLTKPFGGSHPPSWIACGDPATFAKASTHGIGAIAFNLVPMHNLKGPIETYKEAPATPGPVFPIAI